MIEDVTNRVESLQLEQNQSWRRAINLIIDASLPKLTIGDDRPLTKSDFVKGINERLDKLNQIYNFLLEQKIDGLTNLEQSLQTTFFVPLFLLCGENIQAHPWTNAHLIQTSYTILTLLKKDVFKVDSFSKLFSCNPKFLKDCLAQLHEKLQKETWKLYPGAQHCFAWILRQVCAPDLNQDLPRFLPFVLRFLDDWQLQNKIFALHCLDHIIDNVDKQGLSKFGHVEVVQHALFHVVALRDYELLVVALPCIFKTFLKVYGKKEVIKSHLFYCFDCVMCYF